MEKMCYNNKVIDIEKKKFPLLTLAGRVWRVDRNMQVFCVFCEGGFIRLFLCQKQNS